MLCSVEKVIGYEWPLGRDVEGKQSWADMLKVTQTMENISTDRMSPAEIRSE
jgi:hypothetical protein